MTNTVSPHRTHVTALAYLQVSSTQALFLLSHPTQSQRYRIGGLLREQPLVPLAQSHPTTQALVLAI